MDKPNQLTRTCTSCGIQKPLSAFLHLSGTQGTTYGTICSACRGAGITTSIKPSETTDDRSASSSGARIGAKQKLEADLEKKRQLQQKQDTDTKEQKKRDEITSDKTEQAESIEKSEKDRREGYLDNPIKKPTSFLSRTFDNQPRTTTNESIATLEAQKIETAVEQQQRNTTLDLSSPTSLSHVQPGELRYQSQAFKDWMLRNANAPMARTLGKLYGKNLNTAQGITKPETEKPSIDPDNTNKNVGRRR